MKKVFFVASLVLSCSSVQAGSIVQNSQKTKDIVKATKTMTAKLVGFEVGDYVHAILKDSKGKEHSMYICTPGVDYFMAQNKGKTMVITYQLVKSYIEESGGMLDIERVSDARLGKLTAKAWMQSQRKKMSFEQISKKYEPLIQMLVTNRGEK